MDKVRKSDLFLVYSKAHLAPIDYQVLAMLYQPLIGVSASTLYLVLHGLLNRQSMISEDYVHSDLESFLSEKIEKIETSRYRLEAIGLLNSYISNDKFYYELKAPLSPYAFVNDGVLGSYLQSTLTETKFQKILSLFKISVVRTENHHSITKSFNDVFERLEVHQVPFQTDLLNGSKSKSIKVKGLDFDLRLFRESIPEDFFDSNQFTDSIRDKILNLVYVYGLDEFQMKEVYVKSIDSTLAADPQKLSTYAREIYKTASRKVNTTMEEEPIKDEKRPKDPLDYFQTVSPRIVLEDMSSTGKVAAVDLRNVEQLLEDTGIDKGVLNVLLAYVIRIKEGKLPSYDYLEKMAIHWMNDKVINVQVAMDYVIHLNSEYQLRKDQPKTTKRGKTDVPDVEIPWLDDYIASLK
jgi:replication initiation and membrane attachment protein